MYYKKLSKCRHQGNSKPTWYYLMTQFKFQRVLWSKLCCLTFLSVFICIWILFKIKVILSLLSICTPPINDNDDDWQTKSQRASAVYIVIVRKWASPGMNRVACGGGMDTTHHSSTLSILILAGRPPPSLAWRNFARHRLRRWAWRNHGWTTTTNCTELLRVYNL